jgi:hypothetical protein
VRAGGLASSRCIPRGVEPPESATTKRPLWPTQTLAADLNNSDPLKARSSASAAMIVCVLGIWQPRCLLLPGSSKPLPATPWAVILETDTKRCRGSRQFQLMIFKAQTLRAVPNWQPDRERTFVVGCRTIRILSGWARETTSLTPPHPASRRASDPRGWYRSGLFRRDPAPVLCSSDYSGNPW